MGGFTGLFDRPDPTVASLTKNPRLQGYIDSGIADYGKLRDSGNAALDDFIRQYQAGQGNAEKYTGEETGAIGQFYNGDMAQKLAQLRSGREAAVNAAADVAAGQAQRGLNSNRLLGGGTGSSYQQRLAIGALAPIRTQAALENANQQRSDLDYLTGNQVALAGSRGRMQDALAGRSLVPWQTRASMTGTNQGILGGLLNEDQANKFYGIQQKPGLLDRMQQETQFLQGLQSIMKNQYGTAQEGFGGWAGMGGGGGGGGGGMGGMMGGMGGMRRGGLVKIERLEPATHDYRRGGNVRGVGGPTSDSIPAMLSDGEFVMPAAAVRMPGVLQLLHKIRRQALTQAGDNVPRLAGGGLLYADSWGGLGNQALARDAFNESVVGGQVQQIQQQQQFDRQAGLQQQQLNQQRNRQAQDDYRRNLDYYGMPNTEYNSGGGGGTPGPMYGGYDAGSMGFALGGLVRGYAEGGAVGEYDDGTGQPPAGLAPVRAYPYEEPATTMLRGLWERRLAELQSGKGVPLSPRQLQERQLGQTDRQLDIEDRRVKELEKSGSPQEIRDREFQEKQLEQLGNAGGIDSVEHARKLAPAASDTAVQLAFENSQAMRKPAEQQYQNARTASAVLNQYDQATVDAQGHMDAVPIPERGMLHWTVSDEDKAKAKKINEAVAIMKKVGNSAQRLKQSPLVQLDPDSNSWVPAIARPRWMPVEGSAGVVPAASADPGGEMGVGGGLSRTPQAAPTARPAGRRYSPWVYDRVRELSKSGVPPIKALTQALREEQEVFSR